MTEYDIIPPDSRIEEMTAAGFRQNRYVADYLDNAIAAVPGGVRGTAV